MARLFGFVGNRADLGARVLELESKPLNVVAKGATLGWGLGFWAALSQELGHRVLKQRRSWTAAMPGTGSYDTRGSDHTWARQPPSEPEEIVGDLSTTQP